MSTVTKTPVSLDQGPHPSCGSHSFAMCIHMHLLSLYGEAYTPDVEQILHVILARCDGWRPQSLFHMCCGIKKNLCEVPEVWLRVRNARIRFEMQWYRIQHFSEMHSSLQAGLPMPCSVRFSAPGGGPGHAIAVTGLEGERAIGLNSWGPTQSRVTMGPADGPYGPGVWGFNEAVCLYVQITHVCAGNVTVLAVPPLLSGWQETDSFGYTFASEPAATAAPGVALCAKTTVPRQKRAPRRPRGTPAAERERKAASADARQFRERERRQIKKSSSAQHVLKSKSRVFMARAARCVRRWVPTARSGQPLARAPLMAAFGKLLDDSFSGLDHAHMRMQASAAATRLLREERELRKTAARLLREAKRPGPATANVFDDLPLPVVLCDTESDSDTCTLPYGSDLAPDVPAGVFHEQ